FVEVQKLAAHVSQAITPELELQAKQLRLAVGRALNTLTPREERVVRLRFGFEGEAKTLEEIANMFGVTGSRVRQIESRALRKLKHPSRTGILLGAAGTVRTKVRLHWSEEGLDKLDIDGDVFKAL